MKLCITAAGNTLSSPTDSAFGRAPWFVLIDTDSKAVEALANSSVNAVQGAGIAAAQLMADQGVEAILTGRLGPKAQAALAAAGIAMHEGLARCTVDEALQQFHAGQYPASGSDAAAGPVPSAASSAAPAAGATQGQGRGMGGGQGKGCGRCGSERGRQ